MRIPRRSVIGVAAGATAIVAATIVAATMPARQTSKAEPKSAVPFQLIDHLIIKHGGDCCGCAVSKQDGEIICNECGQTLDVLVSEVALIRMAEH